MTETANISPQTRHYAEELDAIRAQGQPKLRPMQAVIRDARSAVCAECEWNRLAALAFITHAGAQRGRLQTQAVVAPMHRR